MPFWFPFKANSDSINCSSGACDPVQDQQACCENGDSKAPCSSMICPAGYSPKGFSASIACAGSICGAVDRDTCCNKQACEGTITFDYGSPSKQDQCTKKSSIAIDATMACYDASDCASMTRCFAREACKHRDMSQECASSLKVCRVKAGSNILSATATSSSSWSSSSSSGVTSGNTSETNQYNACDTGDIFQAC